MLCGDEVQVGEVHRLSRLAQVVNAENALIAASALSPKGQDRGIIWLKGILSRVGMEGGLGVANFDQAAEFGEYLGLGGHGVGEAIAQLILMPLVTVN